MTRSQPSNEKVKGHEIWEGCRLSCRGELWGLIRSWTRLRCHGCGVRVVWGKGKGLLGGEGPARLLLNPCERS